MGDVTVLPWRCRVHRYLPQTAGALPNRENATFSCCYLLPKVGGELHRWVGAY